MNFPQEKKKLKLKKINLEKQEGGFARIRPLWARHFLIWIHSQLFNVERAEFGSCLQLEVGERNSFAFVLGNKAQGWILKQHLHPLQAQGRLGSQHSGISIPGNQITLFTFSTEKWMRPVQKMQLFVRELGENNAGYWEFSNSLVKEASQWQCWYLVSWYQH